MSEYSTLPNSDVELLPGQDMAAIISTSTETLSRILADLKQRRLLEKVATNSYRCVGPALQGIPRELAR